MFKLCSAPVLLIFLILIGSIVANPFFGYAQDDSEFDDEDEGANLNDASFPAEDVDDDDTDVITEDVDDDDTDVITEDVDDDDTDVITEDVDDDDTDVITEDVDDDDTDDADVLDAKDNCPNATNPDQSDVEEDGEGGDRCDTAINYEDTDGDGIPDVTDNCPDQANFDQKDSDGDGVGDACNPQATFNVSVITNAPPVLQLPTDMIKEATGPKGAVVEYTATATDKEDGLSLPPPTCILASGNIFELDNTTIVKCNVTDSYEESTNGEFKITVQDTTPPVISNVPADITAKAPYGAVDIAVTYPIPTANDIVDGSVGVNCERPSGSPFPIDTTTTVSCTAVDSHGNKAEPVTFNVSVITNAPPVLQLPTDMIKEATGPKGAVVEYTATATDKEDGLSLPPPTCILASGNIFELDNTTIVKCNVTDSYEESTNGEFKITVQDTTPPVISNVPADITAKAPYGAVDIAVTYPIPTANDIVDGSVGVNCERPSGSPFPIDTTTTVSCTAVDSHGNKAEPVTFNVSVTSAKSGKGNDDNPQSDPKQQETPSNGRDEKISFETKPINTDVGGNKIPFQYMVILEDSVSENTSTLEDSLEALTLIVENLGAEVFYTYRDTAAGFAYKAPNQQIVDVVNNILDSDPRVKFVEQDQIVVPFSLTNSSILSTELIPTGLERVGSEPLDNDSKISSVIANVDIAIIDSGVDSDHQDLNVYRSLTLIIPQNNSPSAINDPLINSNINREMRGIDTIDEKPAAILLYPPFSKTIPSSTDDECGHGTNVAGVAAAKHNSIGVVGMAPGAKLWAIKVLELNESTGKCEGAMSSIIQAVEYITNHADEIDVVNLSLGCKCKSTALDIALNESIAKNVAYVVAAGNIHVDASSFSPANHPNVMAVSAIADDDGKCGSLGNPLWVDAGNKSGLTADDTFALFSNYGNVIDISAPGVNITTTNSNNTYTLAGGTSIAAPHVAGAIALYKILNPDLSLQNLRKIIVDEGSTESTICDGRGKGYFKEDVDNVPEPLLHVLPFIGHRSSNSLVHEISIATN